MKNIPSICRPYGFADGKNEYSVATPVEKHNFTTKIQGCCIVKFLPDGAESLLRDGPRLGVGDGLPLGVDGLRPRHQVDAEDQKLFESLVIIDSSIIIYINFTLPHSPASPPVSPR